MGRLKKASSSEESAGAPLWMVTFSDCMNLLLTFFVLMMTFSSFSEDTRVKIANLGNAMRVAFETPSPMSGTQDKSATITPQEINRIQQPEFGSDAPTNQDSRMPRDGAVKEDLQTADYRHHKVFRIPSRKVFLGRGRVLSPEGRYVLGVMGTFLKETSGAVVVCENGPPEEVGPADPGLSRASAVIEYLVPAQNLDRRRFGIAAESLAPPEEAQASAPAPQRRERMLEIVLLEGSVQR